MKEHHSQGKLMAMAKRLGADKLRKMIEEGNVRFSDKQIRLFRTLLGVLESGRKEKAA